MENSNNAAVVSSTQTDYGTTTLTNSNTSFNHVASNDNESSEKQDFSYQSLPSYSSTTSIRRHHPPDTNSFYFLPARHTKMSGGNLPNSEIRQISERIQYFLNVLNQICIGFVAIYMSWLCLRTGLAGTGLHAWLVTIGYSFLMAEGIMCHYNGNVLTFSYKRTTKTTIHWVLQALGGGLGVIGTLIKMIQKGFLITSTHGKLGFASFIFCVFSLLSGLSALYSTRAKKFLNPLLNKTFHNLLGLITFIVALLTQYYGYQTGYFSRRASSDFQILMKCITLLSLILTCIGPLKALYHKICNIIRHFKY